MLSVISPLRGWEASKPFNLRCKETTEAAKNWKIWISSYESPQELVGGFLIYGYIHTDTHTSSVRAYYRPTERPSFRLAQWLN